MQRMSKATLLVSVGIFSLSLVLGACNKKNGGTPPPGAPLEVGVVTIQPQRVVVTTELTGRTSAYLIAEVRPQVSGIIQQRLFTEGSEVKAGQVLYQIEPAVYQAAYASAKATEARAAANLIAARLKEERFRELVQSKAVSQQDFDDAYSALKQAEAEVAFAQAAVESAGINLAFTKVKAPISGRIGTSAVTIGALVTANQEAALATIQQLSSMHVDVTQSSAELLRLRQNLESGHLQQGDAGQTKVKLLLENGVTYPLEGVLKFSDVTVDPGTGSVTLRSVFPNPKQQLLPGMFVRAVIQEGVNEQAILVPQRGVSRNPAGQPIVMVVGAEEKVELRQIQTERTLGDNWLVSAGLHAGDRVILEGLQKIRPGMPVKAVPFGSLAAQK